jgi:hypothetical protein
MLDRFLRQKIRSYSPYMKRFQIFRLKLQKIRNHSWAKVVMLYHLKFQTVIFNFKIQSKTP